MTSIIGIYQGEGQISLKHTGNNVVFGTAPPPRYGGRGDQFTPADMLVSALAACSLSNIGKRLEANGENFGEMQVEVSYDFAEDPARIDRITLCYTFPGSLSEEERKRCLDLAANCRIRNSLDKNIQIIVTTKQKD